MVYDYPIVSDGDAQYGGGIAVQDIRQDKSLDQYIAGGIPATIEHIFERELSARWRSAHAASPTAATPPPVHLQIQLTEASVKGPKGVVAAEVTSEALLGVLGVAPFEQSDANVIAHVQMRVQVGNPATGALCENVWNGTGPIKVPSAHTGTSQTYAKALGTAVKSAMANLPAALACAGVPSS